MKITIFNGNKFRDVLCKAQSVESAKVAAQRIYNEECPTPLNKMKTVQRCNGISYTNELGFCVKVYF